MKPSTRNAMANCRHSTVDTLQGLTQMLPAYYCTLHPQAGKLSSICCYPAFGACECHKPWDAPRLIATPW